MEQKKRVALKDAKQLTRSYFRVVGYLLHITPKYTIAWILSIVITAIFPFLFAYILSQAIDQLTRISTTDITAFYPLIAAWILITLVEGVLTQLKDFFNMKVVMKFGVEFDTLVTKKFASLDREYYESSEIMTLIEKVRVAYAGAPLNFVSWTFKGVSSLVGLIVAISIFASYSPVLMSLALFATIPSFINRVIYGKREWYIWSAKEETRKHYSAIRKYLTDSKYLQEIGIYGIRDYFLSRMRALFKEFQHEKTALETKRTINSTLLDSFRVISLGYAFIDLLRSTLLRTISIGQFSFYINIFRQLNTTAQSFFDALAASYADGLFVVDIFKFLDLPHKIVSGDHLVPNETTPPIIELKNVSFRYPGKRRYVIENLNLTIRPKEKIAIVGENGAGKTTLVKLLLRFYDITKGEILINGVEIRKLNLEDLYKHVGVLFQEFNTYHFDARTNIGLGNVADLENITGIENASIKSGADSFIQEYANKYDQVLHRAFEGGTDPSVGQWQRIAIARAFFRNAPILILDEPTSAIDPKAEYELFENIFDFMNDKTVMIISHRFSTVKNATRIIVLDHGKIIEEGNHETLMKLEHGKYKTAFELQKKGYE